MFIAYIKTPFGEKITQIFNISNLKIKQKLNDVGSASFELPISDKNSNYNNFKEFNKISIFILEENEEKLLFSGVVRDVDPNLEKVKIELNDNLFLLRKKKLYTDKNYVDVSIKDILTEILLEINTRKETGIILDCDVNELVSKPYKDGKKFLDILKDLSKNGYEFDLNNNILTFKESIGVDKTTGSKFVEFLFDKENIESNTVMTAKSGYNSDDISNAVTVKDSGNSENTASIDTFGRIEEHFSSGDKDIVLGERKDSVRALEITPLANNFFIANIGDLVKVYINSGSDLLSYDGNLKIIEKEFVSGDLNLVKMKLSTGKIKSLNILEKISEMDSKINDLEL